MINVQIKFANGEGVTRGPYIKLLRGYDTDILGVLANGDYETVIVADKDIWDSEQVYFYAGGGLGDLEVVEHFEVTSA